MVNKPRKARRIYGKVLAPMAMVAFLYVLILSLLLNFSGVFGDLRANGLEALDERTHNKQQILRENMSGRWNDLSTFNDQLLMAVSMQLRQFGADVGDIADNTELNTEITKTAAPTLMKNMSTLGVTGAFMVLDGMGAKGEKGSYAGIYLRDTAPGVVLDDYSDLVMSRGMPSVGSMLNLSLDSSWQSSFSFGKDEGEFFFRPLKAAKAGNVKRPSFYGLWTGPFKMDKNGAAVVTYSEPLIDRNGNVLGVAGIELDGNFLSDVLDSGEASRKSPGCYMLAVTADDADYRCVLVSGAQFGDHFGKNTTVISAEEWLDDNTMALTGTRSGSVIYGSVYPLDLYAANSPYAGERWVLIGLQSAEDTMAFANSFTKLLIISGAAALALGMLVALLTSRSITRPITRVVGQLQSSSPDGQIDLGSTGVQEIDIMAQAIIDQSHKAADQAQRLTSILSVTGTSVGVYELHDDKDTAYCSRGVYQLFGMASGGQMNTEISRMQCLKLLKDKLTDEVDDGIWRVYTPSGTRYLRHRQLRQGAGVFGALTDATTEMENRYRIEHERDYDVLTDLLNRRAFARYCDEVFAKGPEVLKVAAVMMLDLDNLKYMNDTFGHDCGDNYIKAFADALSVYDGPNSICGRRSGDEFYILLYGWDSREELEKHICAKWEQIGEFRFRLPGDETSRLRASGGIAWYPDDAADMLSLVRYADMAMYKVKQSTKGTLGNFDSKLYARDLRLLDNRGELDRMLDDYLVRYAFQPIVSARTGELLGYELLMRPTVSQLSSPTDALELAKQQGVLHHMELLTWLSALDAASQMQSTGQLPPGCKLFINSIANQILSADEEKTVVDRYGALLSQVVLEITESEDNNAAYTAHKQEFIRSHGGVVAIDDYGTGYNSELILIEMPCEYVKLDISFVQGIDTNKDKQTIVSNLISYTRSKNIRVLCEGVENEAELAKLISYGVDYFQGFYIGKPAWEPAPVPAEVQSKIRELNEKNGEA